HVVIKLAPNEKGKGVTIENKTVGGSIPKDFIPAVIKGLNEAALNGVVGGYPVIDIHVEIVDGSYHDVDSNEMAFKIAASMAIQDACKMARPVILEPMMQVEVVTPDKFMGDVTGSLSSKRGLIQGMEARGMNQALKAVVPLSEMFGYMTNLRSMTEGRASFTMEFLRYDIVPANVATTIIEARK
ncbi:MAG: elongation factor G, partial [bacterium]